MDEISLSHLNKIISNRVTSGVVILDATGEILYLNEEARSILATFVPEGIPSDENPAALHKAIVESLKKHLGSLSSPGSTCIQCTESNAAYALRILPLDSPEKEGAPCVMVLIEGITVQRKFDINQVQKQFGLTKRETEVTYCLTKGLTNKEIANALSLSPETIHDYVKQIMKKLDTTTRAGIVGKVLP
jgi:DNA-binding NarL/FixJ family response regulator